MVRHMRKEPYSDRNVGWAFESLYSPPMSVEISEYFTAHSFSLPQRSHQCANKKRLEKHSISSTSLLHAHRLQNAKFRVI